MNLLDVLTSPWAIQPEKLSEIEAIYLAHARGDKPDFAAIEARLGKPLVNERRALQVADGVAVVPIEGVMARRMNLMSSISGGVSTELAAQDIRAAASDSDVHSVILAYDSPGGAAEGLHLLIGAINDARAAGKRVVSLARGTMASAAYWTGSAAESVYIADPLTSVGSIGVVALHKDVSVARANAGVKVTEIVAGKYKRVASENAPLTDEGRREIQAAVDQVYSVFVSDVAKHRRVSVERVLADMADGRVFIGQQAVSAGLADGVASLPELVAMLNRERTPIRGRAKATASKSGVTAMSITREQLQAEAPELLAEIQAEGATAERDRIKAVRAQVMPGHEALIDQLAFDGKTSGPEAAVQVLQAERTARGRAAADLAADAPPPVKQAATQAIEKAKKTKEQYAQEARTLAASKGIPFIDALRQVGYAD